MRNKLETLNALLAHIQQMPYPAVNSNGMCRYRTEDGNKCLVGALIPDELYSPVMECNSAALLAQQFPSIGISPNLVPLLLTAQRAHDLLAWVVHPAAVRGEEIKEEFRAILSAAVTRIFCEGIGQGRLGANEYRRERKQVLGILRECATSLGANLLRYMGNAEDHI